MSTTPTHYKPSPLSFNSPRTSPFRRPASPLAPSPSTLKLVTPTSSPLKPVGTPASQTPLRHATTSNASVNPPAWLNTRGTATAPEAPSSPTRPVFASTQNTVRPTNTASIAARFDGTSSSNTPPAERLSARPAPLSRTSSTDALSKIPPPLLHSMRESFSVLDRDNNGSVNSEDVADMLSQLGLSTTPSMLASYFPNGAQSMNLATYLNTLSDLMSGLSHTSELNAAFEAFDDGDDGQIDLGELKDALMHTPPEAGENKLTEREIDVIVDGFSGRRAFGKGGKGLGRGEVFRYQEFVSSLTGGGNGGENGVNNSAQA
ncbi:EF-hand [Pleomassaria siparia CBS 279.74]|uniref:EF-hand n=1 Tax=Pleomassaria siparia CBS 279.74 TaxID=1314801 RepID=A0A6G1KA80_9PLEO|nr:EF-hand [Pleomassaria siparia CBS 279.74]